MDKINLGSGSTVSKESANEKGDFFGKAERQRWYHMLRLPASWSAGQPG